MAKSQRHKRTASKKAKKAHQQAEAKEQNAPKRWTRDTSWRFCEEPKATFDQVLNTFELLENVLAYLPAHDLLHAQKVCFKMKSTIEQSSELRKKLFLEADYSYMPLWRVNQKKIKKHNQPIEVVQGVQRDYINQETGQELRPSSSAYIKSGVSIPKIINPLVLDILPDLGNALALPSLVNRMLRESLGWAIQPERVHFRLDVRTLPSDSKAQRMFVTQPPTKCLTMRCSSAFCDQGEDVQVRNSGGIKIADLVKAWEEHELKHEVLYPGDWTHCLEYSEAPFSVELEILDGLAITDAEREAVEYRDQKATSMAHANPFAYRRVYPRSCAPFKNHIVVPTPLVSPYTLGESSRFTRPYQRS